MLNKKTEGAQMRDALRPEDRLVVDGEILSIYPYNRIDQSLGELFCHRCGMLLDESEKCLLCAIES